MEETLLYNYDSALKFNDLKLLGGKICKNSFKCQQINKIFSALKYWKCYQTEMNVVQQNTDQLLEELPKLFSEVRAGWCYSMPNSVSSACEEICISAATMVLQKERGLWDLTSI